MKLATADDLFGQPFKRRFIERELPVLGVMCRFRSISEAEFEQYQTMQLSRKGRLANSKIVAGQRQLVALTWCDESGNRILQPDDIDKLNQLDRSDFQVMYDASMEITGSSDEEIEDLAKNSDGDPDDD